MNKVIIKSLSNSCFLTPLAAEWQVEFRTAAYLPTSQRFRDVYGDAGVSYQAEVRKSFCCCFEGWGNFEYFSKHAQVRNCCGNTDIELSNFSGGVNYVVPFCECFRGYVGIGPSVARVKLHNRSCCFCEERITKVPVGGAFKSGIRYYMAGCGFLEVFADYLYLPVHYPEQHVNVGGFKLGGGVGLRF